MKRAAIYARRKAQRELRSKLKPEIKKEIKEERGNHSKVEGGLP